VVLERYSDSASSYVKLDVNNIAVFKQLHRAAKAKLKLRIKATVLDVQDDNNSATPTAQAMPASTPMPLELAQAQMKAIKASLHAQQQYQQDLLKNLQPQQVAQEIQSQPTTHQLQDYQTQLELLEQADTKCRLLESEHVASAAAEPQRLTEAEQDYHMQLMLLEQQNKRRLLMARARAASASRAERQKESEQEGPFGGPFAQFSVCCNSCNNDIPGVHWHCSICVEGDYDLCQDCVEDGQHCHVDHHFLIKRHIENGRVISSTIEMAPKRSLETGMTAEPEVKVEIKSEAAELPLQALPKEIPSTSEDYEVEQEEPLDGSRTCNACVSSMYALVVVTFSEANSSKVFPEQLFVTCLDCEDYDLCMSCHVSNEHGHHPAHEFSPISEVDTLGYKAKALCAPGRNVHHQAICDGCDKVRLLEKFRCWY
jgi:next-to-BRCA1 protein 1